MAARAREKKGNVLDLEEKRRQVEILQSGQSRNARFTAILQACPDLPLKIGRTSSLHEDDVRRMFADTRTMTIDVLGEIAYQLGFEVDVLLYGRPIIDTEALVYGIGIALGEVSEDLKPASDGLELLDSVNKPNFECDEVSFHWHMAVVHHVASIVEGYYYGHIDARLKYPHREEKP